MRMPKIVDEASFGWGFIIISIALGYIFGAPIGWICLGIILVIGSLSFKEESANVRERKS